AHRCTLLDWASPDEFHDFCLQIAKHLTDARTIRPKYANIWFDTHLSTPLLIQVLPHRTQVVDQSSSPSGEPQFRKPEWLTSIVLEGDTDRLHTVTLICRQLLTALLVV